jgi:hypothetical protein
MEKSRKSILKKIAEITAFLDSGMCPPGEVEHFKARLKDLKRDYEQPE